MRRILVAAVIAITAVTALTLAPAGAGATTHHPTVIGKKGMFGPYGVGWGTRHPRHVFNGGDPSGDVTAITWKYWGSRTAIGHGLGSAFKPTGGYYAKPVKTVFKATKLGHCTAGGPRDYTVLWVQQQVRPGSSHYTKWERWAGLRTICSRD